MGKPMMAHWKPMMAYQNNSILMNDQPISAPYLKLCVWILTGCTCDVHIN